jgi:GTP-binding protein
MLGTILEPIRISGAWSPAASSGSVKPNQAAKVLTRDGKLLEQGRV